MVVIEDALAVMLAPVVVHVVVLAALHLSGVQIGGMPEAVEEAGLTWEMPQAVRRPGASELRVLLHGLLVSDSWLLAFHLSTRVRGAMLLHGGSNGGGSSVNPTMEPKLWVEPM